MINYSMMGLMTHREHLALEAAEKAAKEQQEVQPKPEPTEDNKKIMEAMREFMKQQGQKSCNLDPGCESCQ